MRRHFPDAEAEFAIPQSKRQFRYDFRLTHGLDRDVLLEINGGIYLRGNSAHSSGEGIQRDYLKSQLAFYHGYLLVACAPGELENTLKMISYALKHSEAERRKLETAFFPPPWK